MGDRRVLATLIIWSVVGVIMSVMLWSGSVEILEFLLAVVFAFAALVSSGIVWRFGGSEADQAAEKSKRGGLAGGDSRTELLLRLLDDDDRAALKQRLTEDLRGDGEALSLDALLNDKRHNRS